MLSFLNSEIDRSLHQLIKKSSTECGTRLFLKFRFIFPQFLLQFISCLAALQLFYSPPAGGIIKKTFYETLETS